MWRARGYPGPVCCVRANVPPESSARSFIPRIPKPRGTLFAANPLPVVPHRDLEQCARFQQPHRGPPGAAVLDGVPEGLLEQPEDDDFQPLRQVWLRHPDPCGDTETGVRAAELPAEPADGAEESEIVKDRGPQVGNDRTHLVDGIAEHRARRAEFSSERERAPVASAGVARFLQAVFQRRERLPETVVEFARDALALPLLDGEQLVGQRLLSCAVLARRASSVSSW